MRGLERLVKLLDKELNEMADKGELSPTELERAGEAADIIKDYKTICAMDEYGPEEDYGYSGRRMYYPQMTYEGSYRRGRDSMGRYASRDDGYSGRPYYDRGGSYYDGYSGHMDTKREIKDALRDMMQNAANDKERMAIQQFLDTWKD